VDVWEGSASLLHSESHASLGLRSWKEKLLGAVSDACVRRSRRDPRDSPAVEQALYDQLDGVLEACRQRRPAEIAFKVGDWCPKLVLTALDLAAACRTVLERSLTVFHSVQQTAAAHGPVGAVVVTSTAALLPGLLAALERAAAELGAAEENVPVNVRVLGADAVALAVHDLTGRWQRESIAPGHLASVPLLDAQSPALGHARLQYRGADHPVRSRVFTLGRDPRCDLVFESVEFPSISGQHCKITFEPPGFVLHDLSRHGTLVNDRPVIDQIRLEPGDWIRLGPDGPVLRFLGQVLDQRKLLPTA
jgi:hypothetical protein